MPSPQENEPATWTTVPKLTDAGVRVAVETGLASARELGMAISIAVADDGGQLRAFFRMDGAILTSAQVARDKAYTSAASGLTTEQWFEWLQAEEDVKLGAMGGVERLIIFGGGVPIKIDGYTVGAIGVSGGTSKDDATVAQHACAAIGAADA